MANPAGHLDLESSAVLCIHTFKCVDSSPIWRGSLCDTSWSQELYSSSAHRKDLNRSKIWSERCSICSAILCVCVCVTDETSPDAEYVDLLLNPERYTGYKGPSAWRVWNSIYEENCFKWDLHTHTHTVLELGSQGPLKANKVIIIKIRLTW